MPPSGESAALAMDGRRGGGRRVRAMANRLVHDGHLIPLDLSYACLQKYPRGRS
jgi:hypothetical protein